MTKILLKEKLKSILLDVPLFDKYFYAGKLYNYYRKSRKVEKKEFIIKYWNKIRIININKNKSVQIAQLLEKISICPIDNESFFYSLDCYKTLKSKNHIIDNYTIDYNKVIYSSFSDVENELFSKHDEFEKDEKIIIQAIKKYYERICRKPALVKKYDKQFEAIGSLFERPAISFYEALQRILFINQFLWQTGHKHNGLGHLDWILYPIYEQDINKGNLNPSNAKKLISDFFKVLHEFNWFKSAMLLGDTGQIIVLGGNDEDGRYNSNILTYLFIEIAEMLKLPDPKILLRCSSKMPKSLMIKSIECISTGIGAPLLSNDDIIIPNLIKFGYNLNDAYRYNTAACWEPLISGNSSDCSNISVINFAKPFVNYLNKIEFLNAKNINDIIHGYLKELEVYVSDILTTYSMLEFEKDPLLTLFSDSCFERRKDIANGGALYNNIGFTTVGLSSAVNSILSLDKIVFEEKMLSIYEINEMRIKNFENTQISVEFLTNIYPRFGNDDDTVLNLTNKILVYTSSIFNKFHTKLGGRFKFGLSSPNYILDALKIEAMFDGRKSFQPFNVHISSYEDISAVELFNFASILDYSDNRINGNVVDIFLPPYFIEKNFNKICDLIMTAIKKGIYQIQINVVSSDTLIKAKKNPELYPDLVVRVWGFSAYFNDLPNEYKELLIQRAILCERGLI